MNITRENFEALMKDYGSTVHRAVHTITLFREDSGMAEDVEQEIWCRVWDKRGQFSGEEEDFGGWLWTLAVHVTQNWRRDNVERKPHLICETDLEAPLAEEGEVIPWMDQNAVEENTPEDYAIMEDLRRAYEAFPATWRAVWDGKVEGMSNKEIATLHGFSEANVRKITQRMREALG